MFKIIIDGYQQDISNGLVWTTIVLSALIIVGFYLLRSFAIYAMAKKREIKNAYLAFIPCVWIYTACKLVGNARFFNSTFERLALAFAIIVSVGEVLNFIYYAILYFPLIGNFLAGREIFLVMVTSDTPGIDAYTQGMIHLGGDFYGYNVVNPYVNMGIPLETVNTVLSVVYYVSTFTDLAYLVITITLYINLFKTYVPRHYVLFSVLSVMLGIFAPLVFAIRNKTAINYNDYLRERYNMWYANGNPYGGQVNNGAPQMPSTPFEEFADKDEIDPGDPFASFNGEEKKKESNDDEFFD